jgi:hypothetical protein
MEMLEIADESGIFGMMEKEHAWRITSSPI